jgi:hypothetical protein
MMQLWNTGYDQEKKLTGSAKMYACTLPVIYVVLDFRNRIFNNRAMTRIDSVIIRNYKIMLQNIK